MRGPVALVGSGEFLRATRSIDETLLAGRTPRAVILPTAAGREGDERVDFWLGLGRRHYEAMGVEAVPLRVLDRKAADDDEMAARIAGAGLVYLSGGSPPYLAETLRDTAVWRAVLAAHEGGSALAGCSAGACALSALAGGFRQPEAPVVAGLGVVAHVAVIPHFDRFERRDPTLVARFLARAGQLHVIGIDEETGLVGGPERFTVMGRRSVWRLGPDGGRTRHRRGETLELPLPGAG